MDLKKIAKETHPDKLINQNISDEEYDAKVDMYKEAQRSVKNRDWSKVVEIAKELGIDISDIKNEGLLSGFYHYASLCPSWMR